MSGDRDPRRDLEGQSDLEEEPYVWWQEKWSGQAWSRGGHPKGLQSYRKAWAPMSIDSCVDWFMEPVLRRATVVAEAVW